MYLKKANMSYTFICKGCWYARVYINYMDVHFHFAKPSCWEGLLSYRYALTRYSDDIVLTLRVTWLKTAHHMKDTLSVSVRPSPRLM